MTKPKDKETSEEMRQELIMHQYVRARARVCVWEGEVEGEM